ncbi:MAG: SLBB domain-containing protein [Spirochaetota bacterium]
MKKTWLLLMVCLALVIPMHGNAGWLMAEENGTRSSIEQSFDSLEIEEASGLQQFGYDLLVDGGATRSVLVGDEYTVAPGDELRIYMWGDSVDYGALRSYYEVAVDLEGKVFIEPIGRLSAVGLSIADLEKTVLERVNLKYSNISVDVSPASIREFSVYVSGFVKRPGPVQVNGLWTVVDVLGSSKGPVSEGSLRNIQVWRDDQRIEVDLYELFLQGKPIDVTMQTGDVVYVPPVVKTAAVAGSVKRPGIYEMLPGETVDDLLSYAGGLQVSGAALTARLVNQEGTSVAVSETVSETFDLSDKSLQDGDLLLISSGNAYRSNMVWISGTVLYPGVYNIEEVSSLSELLDSARIRYDADKQFGTIFRESINEAEAGITFSPRRIMDGERDIELKPNDRIQLYPFEPAYAVEPIRLTGLLSEPGVVAFEKEMSLLDVLREADFEKPVRELQARIIRDDEVFKQIYLHNLLKKGDRSVDVPMQPGDMVAIVENEEGEGHRGIRVLGEVDQPGVYAFTEGQRLSDVIEEAGGYTDTAYPQALFLMRDSVKETQLKQIQRTIAVTSEELDSLEASLAEQSRLSADEKSQVKAQIASQRMLIEQVGEREGDHLGRISLSLPATLEQLKNSQDNVVLRENDYIFIPERPDFVTVVGDVDSTIALPWEASKRVKDYLLDLGGLRSRDYNITIIKHTGKVVTESNLFYGWSTIEGQKLEPGDAIIAVRKIDIPAGTKLLNVLTDVTDAVYKVVYSLDALDFFT